MAPSFPPEHFIPRLQSDDSNILMKHFLQTKIHRGRKAKEKKNGLGLCGKWFNYSHVLGRREVVREWRGEKKKSIWGWNLRRSPQLPCLKWLFEMQVLCRITWCKPLPPHSIFFPLFKYSGDESLWVRSLAGDRTGCWFVLLADKNSSCLLAAEQSHAGEARARERAQARQGGHARSEHRWKWHCHATALLHLNSHVIKKKKKGAVKMWLSFAYMFSYAVRFHQKRTAL